MHERTDQIWVRELKQEDQKAITDLWEKLFLWGLTLTRKYNQTEDIGRDSAVAAYWRIMERGIYQYKFQGPFLGFCRRVLVNEVNRRMKEEPYVADIDDLAVQHPSTKITDPVADANTILARLQPCLDELKEREREIITLLYMQDLTPETVAETLGISRQNTNVIAFRSRKKLQDCLRSQGYTDSLEVLSA
jgi:RNA polymerase sigma factor (sigma-70 family)